MNDAKTWPIGIKDDDVFVVDLNPLDDRQSEPAMLVHVRMRVPLFFEGDPPPASVVLRVEYTDGVQDEYDVDDEHLRFISGEDLQKHDLTHW